MANLSNILTIDHWGEQETADIEAHHATQIPPERRQCTECKEDFVRKDFSKTQWKTKFEDGRKCKDCVFIQQEELRKDKFNSGISARINGLEDCEKILKRLENRDRKLRVLTVFISDLDLSKQLAAYKILFTELKRSKVHSLKIRTQFPEADLVDLVSASSLIELHIVPQPNMRIIDDDKWVAVLPALFESPTLRHVYINCTSQVDALCRELQRLVTDGMEQFVVPWIHLQPSVQFENFGWWKKSQRFERRNNYVDWVYKDDFRMKTVKDVRKGFSDALAAIVDVPDAVCLEIFKFLM